MFYICGHTKNCCDQNFNAMKVNFHLQNVYTMQQLCHLFSVSNLVDVCAVTPDDFFDWESHLNSIYQKIPTGNTKNNHIFCARLSDPGDLLVKEYDGSDEWEVLKLKLRGDRDENLLKPWDEIERLIPPGIPEIKQVELATKWRKFVPDPYKDISCPLVPQGMIDRIKK